MCNHHNNLCQYRLPKEGSLPDAVTSVELSLAKIRPILPLYNLKRRLVAGIRSIFALKQAFKELISANKTASMPNISSQSSNEMTTFHAIWRMFSTVVVITAMTKFNKRTTAMTVNVI